MIACALLLNPELIDGVDDDVVKYVLGFITNCDAVPGKRRTTQDVHVLDRSICIHFKRWFLAIA